MKKLEGKVALITGAGSGIGLAIAEAFVQAGAYVYIMGRHAAPLEQAVKKIGENVAAVQGDVAELADLKGVYTRVKQDKGRHSVYSASKAAVRSFARTWTADLQDRKIRVNVLSPGTTDTPGLNELITSNAVLQDRITNLHKIVPLGRLVQPAEVAKAAVFLASDDASFITGIELFVDGGIAQI